MSRTPNFTGWRVVILAEEDSNTEKLCRQLALLGVSSSLQWLPLADDALPDLVIVDADRGWDELLPWARRKPARPVAALLGSEAPGRIAWAIDCGAASFIPKPVSASTVYPALVLAVSTHEQRLEDEARIDRLEERLKLRPVVFAAVDRLKVERQIDDERAYGLLRNCAMRRRMPIEQLAALVVGGIETLREVG
ncbi:ANTAR domain-containing protein [Ciceribacter sp. L1K23]|uniref:ANTAR domain-containing response regulator n=1 Tax=unclassified Ciceribacter TaxID=2628820 RepID=UPI001ABECEDD|nr:ANTAR domain-containing protein [Ciceribacter sp. L1K22]MBO3761532.1 ANTAR domain-containing protein [Ciceribacter sp. L1K22]MBR0554508.1 ANTAR domain-containing protein [Ciceribacter sp. L1K23]